MKKIAEIISIRPFELDLKFKDGEVRQVDFEQKFREWSNGKPSIYMEMLDEELFAKVKITKLGALEWPNGIDFCADAIYEWSLEQEKESILN